MTWDEALARSTQDEESSSQLHHHLRLWLTNRTCLAQFLQPLVITVRVLAHVCQSCGTPVSSPDCRVSAKVDDVCIVPSHSMRRPLFFAGHWCGRSSNPARYRRPVERFYSVRAQLIKETEISSYYRTAPEPNDPETWRMINTVVIWKSYYINHRR